MLAPERRARILDLIKDNGSLTTVRISEMMNVSEMTIRRDMIKLEENGLLIRSHGGAMLKENSLRAHLSFLEKRDINIQEKETIARKAASFIKPGDAIAISPGTTTALVAQYIKDIQPLTVVTNAANLVMDIGNYPGIEFILTGGILKQGSFALIGDIAEEKIKSLNINKYFLAVSGIHSERGITTHDTLEAKISRLFIEHAEEVFIVAENHKFGRIALSTLCKVEEVKSIITGKIEDRQKYKEFAKRVTIYEV